MRLIEWTLTAALRALDRLVWLLESWRARLQTRRDNREGGR